MPRPFPLPSRGLAGAASVVALVVAGCAPSVCGSRYADGGPALLREKLYRPVLAAAGTVDPSVLAEENRTTGAPGLLWARVDPRDPEGRRLEAAAPVRDAVRPARRPAGSADAPACGACARASENAWTAHAAHGGDADVPALASAVAVVRRDADGDVAAMAGPVDGRLRVNEVRDIPNPSSPSQDRPPRVEPLRSPGVSNTPPADPLASITGLGISGTDAAPSPAPAPAAAEVPASAMVAAEAASPSAAPSPAPSPISVPAALPVPAPVRASAASSVSANAPSPAPTGADRGAGASAAKARGQGWLSNEQRDYALRLLPLAEDLGEGWSPVDAIAFARSENGQWSPADGQALAERSAAPIRRFMRGERGERGARGGTRIAAAAAYAVLDPAGAPGSERISVSLFFDRFPALPLTDDIFVADMDATHLTVGPDGIGRAARLLGRHVQPSAALPVRRGDPRPPPAPRRGPGTGMDLDRLTGDEDGAGDRLGQPEAVLELLKAGATTPPTASGTEPVAPSPTQDADVAPDVAPDVVPEPGTVPPPPVETLDEEVRKAQAGAEAEVTEERDVEGAESAMETLEETEASVLAIPIPSAKKSADPAAVLGRAGAAAAAASSQSAPQDETAAAIDTVGAIGQVEDDPAAASAALEALSRSIEAKSLVVDPASRTEYEKRRKALTDQIEAAQQADTLRPPAASPSAGWGAATGTRPGFGTGVDPAAVTPAHPTTSPFANPSANPATNPTANPAVNPTANPAAGGPLSQIPLPALPDEEGEFVDRPGTPAETGRVASVASAEAFGRVEPGVVRVLRMDPARGGGRVWAAPGAEGKTPLDKLSPVSFAAFDPLLEAIADELPANRRRAWLIAEGVVARIDANRAVSEERFERAVEGARRRLAAALAFDRRLRDESVARRTHDKAAPKLPDKSIDYVWNPNATPYWNMVAVVGGVWMLEEY